MEGSSRKRERGLSFSLSLLRKHFHFQLHLLYLFEGRASLCHRIENVIHRARKEEIGGGDSSWEGKQKTQIHCIRINSP